MAVGSVDHSTNIPETQSIKEAYDEREQQMIARHKRELAEMEKRYETAISKMQADFSTQFDDARDSSRVELSQREKQHLADIQEMQELNRQRLTQIKEDDQDQYDRTTKALESQVAMTEDKNERDNKRLNKQFMEAMADKDTESSDTEERYRTGSQEALKDQAKRLTQKHDEESTDQRVEMRDHDEKNSDEMHTLRKEKDREITNLKKDLDAQKRNLETKYTNVLENERKAYQGIISDVKEEFHQNLEDSKAKYHGQSKHLTEQFQEQYDNLTDRTKERMDKEVLAARASTSETRNQANSDLIRMKRSYERQRANLANEMQDNVNELDKRRKEGAEDLVKADKVKIGQIKKQDNEIISKTAQDSIQKLEEQKLRDETNKNEQVGSISREADLDKTRHNLDRKKMYQYFNDKTVQTEEFHNDQLNLRQRDYQTMMTEQRELLERQRMKELGEVRDQMAKQGKQHQEFALAQQNGYERQIGELKGDFDKRLKRQNELMRDENQRHVKSMQLEREANESKMNARINSVKETYEREIEQLRKRQAQERENQAMKKA